MPRGDDKLSVDKRGTRNEIFAQLLEMPCTPRHFTASSQGTPRHRAWALGESFCLLQAGRRTMGSQGVPGAGFRQENPTASGLPKARRGHPNLPACP